MPDPAKIEALLAERVMGWQKIIGDDGLYCWLSPDIEDPTVLCFLWRPLTDANQMVMVQRRMEELGYDYILISRRKAGLREYGAGFARAETGEQMWTGDLLLAVALAALAALGVEVAE
jgi:hypothetical protein